MNARSSSGRQPRASRASSDLDTDVGSQPLTTLPAPPVLPMGGDPDRQTFVPDTEGAARDGPPESQGGMLQRVGHDPGHRVQQGPMAIVSDFQGSLPRRSVVPASDELLAEAKAADHMQQSAELMGTVPRATTEDFDRAALAAANRLLGICPRDPIEQMLAAQMIALHSATMDCVRRANWPDRSIELRHEELRLASKTSRAFASLADTLDRRRRGGRQKVTVEHVHVHAGGQAIVGQVTGGSGIGRQK